MCSREPLPSNRHAPAVAECEQKHEGMIAITGLAGKRKRSISMFLS